MPDFVFTGPDGKDHVVSGPEGSTPQQAFQRLQAAMGGGGAAAAGAQTTPDTGGIGRNALASVTEALTGLPSAIEGMAQTIGLIPSNIGGQKLNIGQQATQALNRGVGAATGFNPEDVTANTLGERAARIIPGTIAGALLPGGEGTAVERGLSGARFAVGSTLAQELPIPDWAKPYASFLGGLFGEAGYQGVKAGAKTAASGPTAARFSDTARNQQVRNIIENTAQNPADVKAKAMAPNTGVSEPTFYQQTGDTGIGGLEDTLSTKRGPAFAELKKQQEASRQEALQGIQPEGQGAQFDLSQHMTGQLNDMDKNMEVAAQNVFQKAQNEAANLGSGKSNEARGQEMRDALLDAADKREKIAKPFFESVGKDETGNVTDTIDAAKAIRADALKDKARLGDDENDLLNRAATLSPVERYGVIKQLRSDVSEAMRKELASAGSTQAYRRLTQLRGAIEKNLTDTISDVYAGNIKSPASSDAAELMRGIPKQDLTQASLDVFEARGPTPKPETLSDAIKDRGGIRLVDQNGRLVPEAQEIRNILGPKNKLLASSSAGGLTPDQMLRALADDRGGWLVDQPHGGNDLRDLYGALADERDGRTVFHPHDESVDRLLSHDRLNREMTEAGITGKEDRLKQVGMLARYRASQKNLMDTMPGFEAPEQTAPPKPTTVVKPTIESEDVNNLRKGSALWAQYKSDRLGPVDKILRTAGNQTDFRMPASEVGGVVFQPGRGGYENAQKVVNFLGQEKGQALLADEAAASLSKAALRDDGTIDQKAFGRWQKQYAEALRALPDDVKTKFQSAATATQWADEMKANRAQAVKEMQQGAIGKIMNTGTPEDINRAIGGIFSMQQGGQAAMREIALRARGNPAAEQGLRRATMDFITDKFISNATDKIKSAAFQDFVAKNRDTLSEIFTPSEVQNIAAVAADLKRSNMEYDNQVGPKTGMRNYEVGKGYDRTGLRVILDALGAGAGEALLGRIPVVGRLAAGAGVAGAEFLQGFHKAGIDRIDDALAKVFTNTDFRKQIMSLDPTSGSSVRRFNAAMRRSAVAGAKATLLQQMGR